MFFSDRFGTTRMPQTVFMIQQTISNTYIYVYYCGVNYFLSKVPIKKKEKNIKNVREKLITEKKRTHKPKTYRGCNKMPIIMHKYMLTYITRLDELKTKGRLKGYTLAPHIYDIKYYTVSF